MQCTGYYRIPTHPQNDIADYSDDLIVNCTGMNYKNNESFITNSSRPDFYLLYVTDGELQVTFSDSEIILKSGMCIFYYPNQKYSYRFDGNGVNSYYWVHLTGNAVESILKRFGFFNESVYNIGVHSKVMDLFHDMASEFICREKDFAFSAATYLLRIFVLIRRYETQDLTSVYANKIKASLEILHTKYDTPITIEDLAELEQLSPSRYRTIFHVVTGTSPKQYLTDIRMRRASDLLRQSKLPIQQIGKMVGYDDILYFYRIFKKHMGISPAQYRLKYDESKELK